MERTRSSTEPDPPPEARCARYRSPPPWTASVACSTCGSLGSGPVVHDAIASAKTKAGSERLDRQEVSARSWPPMARFVFHHAGAEGTRGAGDRAPEAVAPEGGIDRPGDGG